MLIPDRLDDDEAKPRGHLGVLGTTIAAFFMAEMGDKTQIATVALAARFTDLTSVIAGTTLGMMLANVPAVFLGERVGRRVPMTLVALGVLTLANVGNLW